MCISAPELHQCLKTNLFVEAEKLTVSYPTVQHAVDMDVVGLQQKVGINTAALLVSSGTRTQLLWNLCIFVCVIGKTCCMGSNATFLSAEGGIFNYFPEPSSQRRHYSSFLCRRHSRLDGVSQTHTNRCQWGVIKVKQIMCFFHGSKVDFLERKGKKMKWSERCTSFQSLNRKEAWVWKTWVWQITPKLPSSVG